MLGMYEIAAVAAAGRAIRVTTEEPALAAFVRDYLDCFLASDAPDSGDEGAVVRIVADYDVPPIPGETTVAIAAGVPLTEENQFHVCFRVTQAMAAVLLDSGVALLHAGLAEIAGRRVLLAGASGAGKTTAGRRLPTPWRSLSDDATQVLFDERGAACAAPWPTISRITSGDCSERWACNDVAPLAAIFYLRHSAADELRRMGGAEAAGNLYVSMRQFYAVRLAVRTARPWMVAPSDLLTAAQRVAKAVPTYELGHARWGRFWELIESAIDGAPPAESATGGAGRARET